MCPLYEYKCEGCETVTEAFQKMADAPLTECPSCKGKLYKLISRSSFHLKGTGWYVTDYAKSDSPPTKKETVENTTKNTTEKTAAEVKPVVSED